MESPSQQARETLSESEIELQGIASRPQLGATIQGAITEAQKGEDRVRKVWSSVVFLLVTVCFCISMIYFFLNGSSLTMKAVIGAVQHP